MAKTNIQIRVPEEVASQIEELAPPSRSAFVREAIQEKIQREKFRQLEAEWIEALAKKPEDLQEAKRWAKAESWGPR